MPLSLLGVSKRWRDAPRAVLDGVTLILEPGVVTRVDGANGAGKTTLLRIAAGLVAPDSGDVRLGALSPDRDRAAFQRRTGFLAAASTGLYPRLTVRHHLELWTGLALLSRAERAAAVSGALDGFALGELRDRRVDRLSAGQRQRVRMAGAFVHRPDVVLLDEPTNSLDSAGTAILARALDEVRERGGSAVWCAPEGEGGVYDFERRLTLRDGLLEEAVRADA